MSSLTIKELITSWGFQVDDKALKGLDDKLAKLQSSVKWVGGLAVGAAAAMFGLAKSTADAGTNAARAAAKLGIGVEALQEYRYAAELAGVGADGFDDSLRFLQKNLADTRAGTGEAKDAFFLVSKALGRDVVRSGKPAEAVLLDIADAFQTIGDASKRVQIAQKIFGDSGAKLIPMLAQGSGAIKRQRQEARALGVVMDEGATKASEAFTAALTRARGALTGLRNVVGIRLLPMIQRLTDRFTAWVVANRAWLALGVERAVAVLTDYIGRAINVFSRIGRQVTLVVQAFGGWERVARVVTTAMIAIMALRMVSFLGQLIMGLGRAVAAFTLLGNAGLLAQLKLALIPLAIGAAFAALIVIIEDVVAYFQGRKSVTGAIVKNFDGLADMLFKKFDAWTGKAAAFAKKIGEAFTGFLLDLKPEDFKKFGDFMMKVLDLAIIGSGLAIQLGLAIGEAVLAGIEKAMREKAPALARLIFGEDAAQSTKLKAIEEMKKSGKSTDAINAELERIDAEESKGIGGMIKRGGKAILNFFGTDLDAEAQRARDAAQLQQRINDRKGKAFPDASPTPTAEVPAPTGADLATISAALTAAANGQAARAAPAPSSSVVNNNARTSSSVRVEAPITVNVPAGTSPDAVAGAARSGVRDSLDSILREAGRQAAPAVQY